MEPEQGEEPQVNDVLMGRGKLVRRFPGTLQYMEWIRQDMNIYDKMLVGYKIQVCKRIVGKVEAVNGRFLEKIEGKWRIIDPKVVLDRTVGHFRSMIVEAEKAEQAQANAELATVHLEKPQTKGHGGHRNRPQPQPKDVLCGRGKDCHYFPGTQRYFRWIHEKKEEYKAVTEPGGKRKFAASIVQAVYDEGGRFLLKKNDQTFRVIATKEATTRTGQLFRNMIGNEMLVAAKDPSSDTTKPSFDFEQLKYYEPGLKKAAPPWRDKDAAWLPKRETKRRRRRQPDGPLQFPEEEALQLQKSGDSTPSLESTSSKTQPGVSGGGTRTKRDRGCKRPPRPIGECESSDNSSYNEDEEENSLSIRTRKVDKDNPKRYNGPVTATQKAISETNDGSKMVGCDDESPSNYRKKNSRNLLHNEGRYPPQPYNGRVFKFRDEGYHSVWEESSADSDDTSEIDSTDFSSDNATDDWSCNDDSIDNWSSDTSQMSKPDSPSKRRPQGVADGISKDDWSKSSEVIQAGKPKSSRRNRKPQGSDYGTNNNWASYDASQVRKPERFTGSKPQESEDRTNDDRSSSSAFQARNPEYSKRNEPQASDDNTHNDWSSFNASQMRKLECSRREESEDDANNGPWSSGASHTGMHMDSSRESISHDEDSDWTTNSAEKRGRKWPRRRLRPTRNQPVHWEDRGVQEKESNEMSSVSKTTPPGISCTNKTRIETERSQPVHLEGCGVQEKEINDMRTVTKATPATCTDKTLLEIERNQPVHREGGGVQEKEVKDMPTVSKATLATCTDETPRETQTIDTKDPQSPPRNQGLGIRRSSWRPIPNRRFAVFESESDDVSVPKKASSPVEEERKKQTKAMSGKATKDPPSELETNASPDSPLEVLAHDRPSTTTPPRHFDQDVNSPTDRFMMPNENDVLVLDSGERFVQSHPGTACFLELVEDAKMECGAAIIRRQQGGPLNLINRIVEEVYDKDGCFLEKDGGVEWLEIPREDVMDMTARMLFPHSLVDELNLKFEDDSAIMNVHTQPLGMCSKEGGKPNSNDVLFGSDESDDGDLLAGTVKYFRMIKANKKAYDSGEKSLKLEVLNRIITLIHASNGRFLQKMNDQWLLLPIDQVLARTAQAFCNLVVEKGQIPTDHQSAKIFDAPRGDMGTLPLSSLESLEGQPSILNQKPVPPEVTHTSLVATASIDGTQCNPSGSLGAPSDPHPSSLENHEQYDHLKLPPPPPPRDKNSRLVQKQCGDQVRRPLLSNKSIIPPTGLLGYIPGSASETDLDLSQDESSSESDHDDASPGDRSVLEESPPLAATVPQNSGPLAFSSRAIQGDEDGHRHIRASTEQPGANNDPPQISQPVEDSSLAPTTLGYCALPASLTTEDDQTMDNKQQMSHASREGAKEAPPNDPLLHDCAAIPPTALHGCVSVAPPEEELYIEDDDPSSQRHTEHSNQNEGLLTRHDVSPSLPQTTPLDGHDPAALSKECDEQHGQDIDERCIDEGDVSETESEDSLPMKRLKLGG